MKTKLDSWKDLFEKKILDRGYKYYQDGQVALIDKLGNIYSGIVEGLDDYNVHLKIEDNCITELDCSCPYAKMGYPCKHEAAMLYVLENPQGDYQEMLESAKKKDEHIQKSIMETLEELSKEDLVKLISKLVKNDQKAAELFYDPVAIVKSLAVSVEDMDYDELLEYYEVEFNKIALKIKRAMRLNEEAYYSLDYSEGDGSENAGDHDRPNLTHMERKLDDAQQELRDLTNRIIENVLVPRYVSEAYVFLLELMMRTDLDDVANIKNQLRDNATNHLIEAFGDFIETLNGEQLMMLKKCVMKENSELFEEPEGETLFFMKGVENTVLSRKEENQLALSQVDQILEKYTTKEHCDIDKVNQRVKLMKRLGSTEQEVDQFLNKFKDKREYKLQKYKEALEGENYVEALRIMESIEGVGDSRKREKENIVELINLYTQLGETEKLASELEYMIKLYPEEAKDYVFTLRDILEPQEWEKFRDEVILPNENYGNLKMEILEEDGLYERILEEINKRPGDLRFFERYADKLKDRYPQELSDWLVEHVRQKLTYAAKRQSYRNTVSNLLKLLEFPNGKKTISDAVHEWKRQYRNRTALCEELDNVLELANKSEEEQA